MKEMFLNVGHDNSIYLVCENLAFDAFKKVYSDIGFEPEGIETSEDGDKLLVWKSKGWFKREDVHALALVMNDLDSKRESGYAYKFLGVTDGDKEAEYANEAGDEKYTDFYSYTAISLPSKFKNN